MAKKNITLAIDDNEFTTTMRRVKKREAKAIIRSLAGKADEIVKLVAEPDFLYRIPDVLEENIDFVCELLIIPFVGITDEQLEEMDGVDVAQLIKDFLAYNNISIEKIINFLKPDPATRRAIAGMLNFEGAPSTLT